MRYLKLFTFLAFTNLEYFRSGQNVTYTPGLTVDGSKRGHPLKSFAIPGPPSLQGGKHGNLFNPIYIF